MNHAQEARWRLDEAISAGNTGHLDRGELCAAIAQVHATLALAEAQKEANEQARIANLIALLQHSDRIPEAAAHEIQDELFAVGGALTHEARTALGLGDTND